MTRRDHGRFQTPVLPPPPLDLDRHALFLDLDGTLIELAEKPNAVSASAELLALLHVLSRRMNGAIALITGRTIADADRILAGALPTIAGVHGFEMRTPKTALTREPVDLSSVNAALKEARSMIASGDLPALIEDKLSSIALHYRQAPEYEPVVRKLAERLAQKHGLRTLEGKMVIELAAGARTKADALIALIGTKLFEGRSPIAVGDDVTDENAFGQACAHGGHAVLVGEGRPSLARYLLANPTEVFRWLSAAVTQECAA